ncbi:MAG: sensor histidine kinase [Gemmatimonadaceae bacterium]
MRALGDLHAVFLQGSVTLGTAALSWYLYAKYRRPYVLWWSWAWTLYVLRIGAIIGFLTSEAQGWLFLHQILTGWTALFLLWAAMTFAEAATWRPAYALALLFPLTWSWIAIYELESFMLAAVPAVLFLSFATLWTGWLFVKQWRASRSRGSAILAAVLLTWGLHHLDYPVLRARGAWDPWGYYLDILFVLATGIGTVVLVLEQLDRRTNELARLSTSMVQQHEAERRRVSLELHDQTAQVWAGVRLQLGLIHEAAPAQLAPRLERAIALVDEGIRSIRNVTTNLRPPLLDDLGLVPALHALCQSFAEQSGLTITFDGPAASPAVSNETGLALYRALQEALSNVARHSGGTAAAVRLVASHGGLTLEVRDNGRGFPLAAVPNAASLGLTGMRERIAALRGSVSQINDAGAALVVRVPLAHAD